MALKEIIILGCDALDFGGCWEYTMEKRDPCYRGWEKAGDARGRWEDSPRMGHQT